MENWKQYILYLKTFHKNMLFDFAMNITYQRVHAQGEDAKT